MSDPIGDSPVAGASAKVAAASSRLGGAAGYFAFTIVIGLAAILRQTGWSSRLAPALMWMLACLTSGAAVGFLFGIPKILQSDAAPPSGTDGAKPPDGRLYRQQVNTNLTEISDWLTKIIVGLGLINLSKLPPQLHESAAILARDIQAPSEPAATAFALGLIVFFSIVGFLFGYLFTRLFLSTAFSEADQKASAAIRYFQEQFASTRVQVASLETGQALLRESVYAGTESRGAAARIFEERVGEPPANESTNGPTNAPTNEDALMSELARMADAYMRIDAPDYAERVRLKDRAATRMANFVLKRGLTKSGLTGFIERSATSEREGLVLALATVINSFGEREDLDRLLSVAPGLTRLHVKYRVVLALGALIRSGFVRPPDRGRVLALLRAYEEGADGSLRRVVDETVSLMESTSSRAARPPQRD